MSNRMGVWTLHSADKYLLGHSFLYKVPRKAPCSEWALSPSPWPPLLQLPDLRSQENRRPGPPSNLPDPKDAWSWVSFLVLWHRCTSSRPLGTAVSPSLPLSSWMVPSQDPRRLGVSAHPVCSVPQVLCLGSNLSNSNLRSWSTSLTASMIRQLRTFFLHPRLLLWATDTYLQAPTNTPIWTSHRPMRNTSKAEPFHCTLILPSHAPPLSPNPTDCSSRN